MQNRHVFALLFLTLTAGSFAQSTNLSLPTSDNTSNFNVSNSGSATLLKLNGDAGFYVGGTLGTGTIPVTGAGSRMMWYPAKAAFRAGYLDGTGTQWDDANIGQFSIAMGYNPTAIGFGSVAIGANANVSVCNYSVAIGYGAQVTRNYSVAIGTTASATGSNALALGASASATSSWSAAIGYNAEASGIYSTALGPWVSTNGQ
ncbi:hypothetical protein JW992_01250, partial [candidate division KSB1 bacterium]|nr:hypothetical protein [candidate division KSB1 bacterium]